MSATMETLDNKRVKLTVEVDPETFEQAMQAAYLANRSKYSVPGFRKGKVPRKVLETQFSEAIFYEDAFEKVYPDAYTAAVDEFELKPVERPDIDVDQIGEGQPLIFTAEFFVKPEVVLGQYKGIEVEEREYTVTDADVDEYIQNDLERTARFSPVERPVQMGDRVVLDYVGLIDGERFDGGTANDAVLDVGSGAFIPGFEPQLVGLNAGEKADIAITFPMDYHADEVAGKDALFRVEIKEIKAKDVPALDDETVKDISEYDTVAEYTQSIREKLTGDSEKMAKDAMENEAVLQVVKNAQVDIPQCMALEETNGMLFDLQVSLRMNGISLEQYFAYLNTTVDEFREKNMEEAELRVRHRLVFEALQQVEDIQVDEADLDVEIDRVVKMRNFEREQYVKDLTDQDREGLTDMARATKTVDFIMANVVYVEKKPEETQKSEDEGTGEQE